MAALKKIEPSVTSTDVVQLALGEAMERINACAPTSTLIASIPQDEWDSLDHSEVNPLVADKDGLDFRDEDEVEHVA
ncbi:hypothetical protein ACFOOL_06870 [Devosia honganensis]|uniref:Uncharacterized protein n=1 Tax=Devosia honganensis TaxID=1610527 RepID=A0ABV7X1N2_9HYPH